MAVHVLTVLAYKEGDRVTSAFLAGSVNTNPVIVQSDRSILLETDGPLFDDARDAIASFAELLKSPEHIHTYRISPLSLCNDAAAGLSADRIIGNDTKDRK